MNNVFNFYFYMKTSCIKSFAATIITVIMLVFISTSAAFSQETPSPSPTVAPTPDAALPGDVIVAPTPVPTVTPVISPPAPKPPTDIPNLNDNPPELPDIPPAPPLNTPDYSNTPRALPAPDRVGVDLSAQTPLSLDDAIRLALNNNNDIEMAQSDVKSAEFDLTIADGAYIPRIVTEAYFQHSKTPVASTLGGGPDGSLTQTSFNADAGLSGQVPYQGGSFTSNFQANRATTNNTFTSLNPQYPSSLNFQYIQPLFRGRRFDQTRRQIEIAKKNLSLTDAQFRQRVIEIIAQVETAYWDLVYSQRNLQVQLDGVKLANAQVASNERQVEQGVLAPSDVIAAKTQVATFEQNVFVAQQSVTSAENNLKNLMLADRNSPMWSNPLVPVTPVALDVPKGDLPDSLVTALANRPEITQLQTTAEINKIDQRFYRDQTKPQINLVGSYTSAGLAGTLLPSTGTSFLTAGLTPLIARINELSALQNLPPVQLQTTTGSTIPGNLTGGYFQSLTNVFLQRYPTYQIGVQVSLPFKNTVAKANLGKSLEQGTRIQSQRDKQELQIETEVRNALQAVRSQQARLQAAIEARTAAEQLYESEQRKFQSGTSTVFLVLQRQTDLINARGREVQAQTDLNKAITQYQRSIGTTLDAAGVSFNNRAPEYARPKRAEITTVFGDSANKPGEINASSPR